MSSDYIIRVEGVGKRYRIGTEGAAYKSLRDSVVGTLRRPMKALRSLAGDGPMTQSNSFWALRDLDFDVRRGEVIGVIGRNGAGKSTLLKILSNITKPTTGQIELRGRVGSLLEVGTGFHPELTGRENIYLNGAILGMSMAETRRKFDEIVAFSEVERFLDTPVKQYSSGMYTRLAFAVAAHLDPEILIVDEVLAVGDAEFQQKCLGKMKNIAGNGRTVLFVSHQMNAVRALCDRCIMLNSGQIERIGLSSTVIDYYMAGPQEVSADWRNAGDQFAGAAFIPNRFAVVDVEGESLKGPVGADQPIRILIEGMVVREHVALNVGIAVYTSSGELLFWAVSTDRRREDWPDLSRGPINLITAIPSHLLNEGSYRIELIASMHHVEWISEPGRNAPALSLSIQGKLSESPYWMSSRPGLLAPILDFICDDLVLKSD